MDRNRTGNGRISGWKPSFIGKLALMWLGAAGIVVLAVCKRVGEGFALLLVDLRTGFADNPQLPYAFRNKLIVLTALFLMLVAAVLFTRDFCWRLGLGKRELVVSPQAAGFQRCVNLCLAALAAVFLLEGVELASASVRDASLDGWTGDTLIAHACGGIDECSYTNSLEAFEQSYANGMRSIEVDFLLTSDDRLVCCHEWAGEPLCSGYEAGYLYTEEEFLNIRIYDRYTPMSVETVFELLKKYEDVWIVTDTKYTKAEDVHKEFRILLEAAEATDSMEVLDRFVVQLYSYEMYDVVEELHSFPSYILTLYRLGGADREGFTQHCRFLAERGIDSVTMWYYWVSPELMEIADRYGISVYVHTVNDVEDMEELRGMGVKGFYTDYGCPDMLPWEA